MISAQWVLSSVMNCWHQSYILSLWTEEKGGLSGKRIVTWEKQGGQPLSNIQHGFWQCNVVGLSRRSEWIILSTKVNLCLLGKRIASYKFCLGRTCISITMKFINEVVNGGVTIILFVVTNLVCVPKKRKLSNFRGLEGAWKHIRTLEWKWKRDVTPVSSEMARSLAQEEGVDPYHLDLVLISLFFF